MADRLLTLPTPGRLAVLSELHLGGDPPSSRSAQERDVDRVKYSSAFARLAGITQVTAPEAGGSVGMTWTTTAEVCAHCRKAAETGELCPGPGYCVCICGRCRLRSAYIEGAREVTLIVGDISKPEARRAEGHKEGL